MQIKEKFYTNVILTGCLILLLISYVDFRRFKKLVKSNMSLLKEISDVKCESNINLVEERADVTNTDPRAFRAILKQSIAQNGNVADILGVKFYVPYYPIDSIQRVLVETGKFFEQDDILYESVKYLDKDSVVLDIGANIGNHTLYWSKILKVKKVYAFEPVTNTYEILKKNIELNSITSNNVSINNIGLGDEKIRASIVDKNYYFGLTNIGGTSIKQDNDGDFNVTTLDDFMKENFKDDKIDLIKIDVEGYEYKVLVGAKETLKKYSPVIILECYDDHFEEVNSLLNDYGYERIKVWPNFNHVYIRIKK